MSPALTHLITTSPLTWPTIFLTQQLLPILALAYTPPTSPLRRLTTITTIYLAYKFSHLVANFAPNITPLRATSMCFTWVFILNNNDLLNLSGLTYEKCVAWKLKKTTAATAAIESSDASIKEKEVDGMEERKTKVEGESTVEGSAWDRFKWATGMVWNFRRIGTQYQQSPINVFSVSDPSYVPSRRKFLLRTFLWIAISKCMLTTAEFIMSPPQQFLYLYTKPYLRFFPRLSEVTLFETVFRSIQVAALWFKCGAGQFNCYMIFAFFCVGLGIHGPEQWPPYFGFVSDTWSVRQFWGYVDRVHSFSMVWLMLITDLFGTKLSERSSRRMSTGLFWMSLTSHGAYLSPATPD